MKVLDVYKEKEIFECQKSRVIDYERNMFDIYPNQFFKLIPKNINPLASYSNVFWSYFNNKYFEENAPRYFLVENPNIVENYYPFGTIGLKVTGELLNILEYLKKYPDDKINIEDYKNYCGMSYDYRNILQSSLFNNREDLRKQLEIKILFSLLRREKNSHKNLSFIVEKEQIISLCPILDYDFSLLFLYLDEKKKRKHQFCYQRSLNIPYKKAIMGEVVGDWTDYEQLSWNTNLDNILFIIKKDTDVVKEFSQKLSSFIEEIESYDILIGNKLFFDKYIKFNMKQFNDTVKEECLESARTLKFFLEILITLYEKDNLQELTIQRYLEIRKIDLSYEEYNQLNIKEKLEIISPSFQKIKTF